MRSIFFVPSNRLDFFKNASTLACDAIIFDLEDAIGPDQVSEGILNIKNNMNLFKKKQKKYIRIDPLNYKSTVEETLNLPIDGYVIPKFENMEAFHFIVGLNDKAKIILLVETALGFHRLTADIGLFTKNIEGLAFGAEDYCNDMGCADNFSNLLFARMRLIEIARILKIDAYDTIYPFIKDDDGFIDSLKKTSDQGFDGKMLIHPAQLNLFNKIKSSKLNELQKIVAEYENNLLFGKTVLVINGRIYERNHIEHMKKKITEITAESK